MHTAWKGCPFLSDKILFCLIRLRNDYWELPKSLIFSFLVGCYQQIGPFSHASMSQIQWAENKVRESKVFAQIWKKKKKKP